MKRFWRWLRAPEPVGVPYERVIELREESFQIGVAVGELRGRKYLADEIAKQFYPDCVDPMTAKDAAGIKARQLQ